MKKSKIRYISHSAVIAAIYVVLTLVSGLFGLANGAIQIRFSEALTILPIFTPAAIPGLFVGCMLANLLTGALIPDVIFGGIATLIGAFFTYLLRQKPILATLPPIISNTVIIPIILSLVYCFDGSLLYFTFTVGIGEILSCGVLGTFLARYLKKNNRLFH